MKIHQLQNGARFLSQGEEYVKTGPLFGTGKGGQKLIPRSAVIQALDPATGHPASSVADDKLSRAEVLAAYDVFHAECRNLVEVDRLIALDRARTKFIKALG